MAWKEKQVKGVRERILESELKPPVDTLKEGWPDIHLQQLSIVSALWDIFLWHNLNLISLENTINTH